MCALCPQPQYPQWGQGCGNSNQFFNDDVDNDVYWTCSLESHTCVNNTSMYMCCTFHILCIFYIIIDEFSLVTLPLIILLGNPVLVAVGTVCDRIFP
jgi:hypothetical protein